MDQFKEMLNAVAQKPAMYVGTTSLYSVSHYMDGYLHALEDVGVGTSFFFSFQRFISLKFLISSTGWHWARILLHVYGSDKEAIQALPGLYTEYEEMYAAIGAKGIESELSRQLINKYGEDFYEPESTHIKPISQP